MTFWRPISELTDDHLLDRRKLILGNSCNGPVYPDEEGDYPPPLWTPDDVRQRTPWTHFAVVPYIED